MSTFLVLKPENEYSLTIIPEAIEDKRKALAALDGITAVTNADELQAAASALATAAGVVKGMETTRVAVKAPILDAGRRIDKMAGEFSKPLDDKMDVIRKMVADFHIAENKRVQAEREAEEKRLAAIEKARAAEEARILAERQAREKKEHEDAIEAEKQRLAAIPQAEADPFAEMRETSMEDARQEAALKAKAHEDARLAEIEAQRLSAQSQVVVRPAPAKASGVSSRTAWTFEVLDATAVYSARPDLAIVTVVPAQVNASIRNGLRDCPGLRIFEEVQTSVRSK